MSQLDQHKALESCATCIDAQLVPCKTDLCILAGVQIVELVHFPSGGGVQGLQGSELA